MMWTHWCISPAITHSYNKSSRMTPLTLSSAEYPDRQRGGKNFLSRPSPSPKSQIQVPNPGPKSRSQIQVPNSGPKSRFHDIQAQINSHSIPRLDHFDSKSSCQYLLNSEVNIFQGSWGLLQPMDYVKYGKISIYSFPKFLDCDSEKSA